MPSELHVGCCAGADTVFGKIAWDDDLLPYNAIRVVVHPGPHGTLCPGHDVRKPRAFKIRNRNIVDESETLIAAPFTFMEAAYGSGTWQTVRMARSSGRRVVIVYRDGSCARERWFNE